MDKPVINVIMPNDIKANVSNLFNVSCSVVILLKKDPTSHP